MERLLEVMRHLRAEGGCPWDRAQTHDSLRPYLLEEASEAVDAIGGGKISEIVEELGDVLLQIAFHGVIGEEEGRFGYAEIEQAIVDKLYRRHPHVFGDRSAHTAEEVRTNWEADKARERGEKAPCERVPHSMPALMRAYEWGRLSGAPMGSLERVTEALEHQDLGVLLMEVVNLCRKEGKNPELLLRGVLDGACSSSS